MEILIEHTVMSNNRRSELRRARIFRWIGIIGFVVLALIEGFAFTMSQLFYYTDKVMFRSYMVYLLLFSIPAVLFVVGMFWLSSRQCVEFDYRLTQDELIINRCISGNRRKQLAGINLSCIEAIGRVFSKAYEDELSESVRKKPMIACCNLENPNLYFLKVRYPYNDTIVQKVVVIEPSHKMLQAMRRICGMQTFCEDSEWVSE